MSTGMMHSAYQQHKGNIGILQEANVEHGLILQTHLFCGIFGSPKRNFILSTHISPVSNTKTFFPDMAKQCNFTHKCKTKGIT